MYIMMLSIVLFGVSITITTFKNLFFVIKKYQLIKNVKVSNYFIIKSTGKNKHKKQLYAYV